MMALVRIALQRPHTFVVFALLILIGGILSALRTPTDIFPEIPIPVIAVVWQYTGLPPDQMTGRIMTPFERALTTTVNDIEHIEGVSYTSYGVVKIFFQPTVNVSTANAQVTAVSPTLLRNLPTGTTPPLVLNYSASTVPIIQLALSGKGLSEQNLSDIGADGEPADPTRRPQSRHHPAAGARAAHPSAGRRLDGRMNARPTTVRSAQR